MLASALLLLPSRGHADDAWVARDKALHFGVSAAIAASGYGASALWVDRPAYRLLAGSSLALAAGVGKEIWDATGHGDPSLKDLTWDALGALTGASFALGIDYLWQRLDPRHTVAAQPGLLRF